MALISNIGASIFTTLEYTTDTGLTLPTSNSEHQGFVGGNVTLSGILVDDLTTSSSGTFDVSITSLVGTLPDTGTLTIGGESVVWDAVTIIGNVAQFNIDGAVPANLAVGAAVSFTGAAIAASAAFTEVEDIRDFPAFGAPANVVNVPVYGQAVSQQIQGQSDAPTLEFNLNYVPSKHSALQDIIDAGGNFVFKITLKNAEAADADDAVFYVKGQFASLLVTPNLTDSTQATLTVTTTSGYEGPFASR